MKTSQKCRTDLSQTTLSGQWTGHSDSFKAEDLDHLAVAFHGDDYIDGEGGDDYLYGQGGSDTLYGGEGDDAINTSRTQRGTTNSIALRAGISSSKCRKCLKNRAFRRAHKIHAKSGSRPINTCAECYANNSNRTTPALRSQFKLGDAA